MAQILPTLPDPVKFSYTYRVTATYWVSPASGIVVDLEQHEVRSLGIVLNGQSVPVTSVMDISFTSPASTLAAAAKDATAKGNAVKLIYTTVPLTLLIAGLTLLLFGVVGLALTLRRPRTPVAGQSDSGGPAVETIAQPDVMKAGLQQG